MPAPSSRTTFSLTDGSIPKTSGCSCCVRTPALLSSIISSTLCAVECLFQNSVICSRVWGLGSTRSVTEIAEMLNHHMTWMAPCATSLENHMKRKSHIWGPYAMLCVKWWGWKNAYGFARKTVPIKTQLSYDKMLKTGFHWWRSWSLSCKSAYDLVKIKNRSHKQSHKRQVQKSDRINSDRQSGSDQLGSTRTNSDRIKK